ncbi:hypothetical protein [Aequorivita sublithincola]|nr:hypothetical protein [Aequorivita sublithincola]
MISFTILDIGEIKPEIRTVNNEAIKTSFNKDDVLDNTLEYYTNGKQKRTKSDNSYKITEFIENGEMWEATIKTEN